MITLMKRAHIFTKSIYCIEYKEIYPSLGSIPGMDDIYSFLMIDDKWINGREELFFFTRPPTFVNLEEEI